MISFSSSCDQQSTMRLHCRQLGRIEQNKFSSWQRRRRRRWTFYTLFFSKIFLYFVVDDLFRCRYEKQLKCTERVLTTKTANQCAI